MVHRVRESQRSISGASCDALRALMREGRLRATRTTSGVASYVLVPILLVLMSLGLTGLIYWGGVVEERRNRTRA
ncbi:MAG: hypothetical protein NVS4B13_02030 [Candidatus Elarobacter sp.]